MRKIPSDKYTVAWFKLADFVARREKERALGLYRLLMHSIDDEALSHQLAGDLFLAFDSTAQAVEKYSIAAEQYREQKRLLQAVAVYEQIVGLQQKDLQVLEQLLELYTQLTNKQKAVRIAQKLCLAYLPSNEETALMYGKKAVDGLVTSHDQQLQTFLSEVQAAHEAVYQALCEYLKR